MLEWKLIDPADWYGDEREEKQYGNRGQGGYQCACGRFAKFVSSRHYYNGWYDCYASTLNCQRCGEVEVKCT